MAKKANNTEVGKKQPTFNQEFRPSDMQSVIGQDDAKEVLINSIKSNQIQNSYIFQGPKGVAKTTMARAYAKTLNCLKPIKGVKPCGKCDACLDYAKDPSYAGVIELDAGSEGKVDDIRELKSKLHYAPKYKYTVVIIDEGHNLTTNSETALLKICEEPPEWVIFIFATTNADSIMETIKSRSLIVKFTGVPDDKIENHLAMICKKKKISIEDDALKCLSSSTNGCVRDAVKNLQHAFIKCNKKTITKECLETIIDIEPKYIEELFKLIFQEDIQKLLSELNSIIRNRELDINESHLNFFLDKIRHNLYNPNVFSDNKELILDIYKIFISEKERLLYNIPVETIIECALIESFNRFNKPKKINKSEVAISSAPKTENTSYKDSTLLTCNKINLFKDTFSLTHTESDFNTVFKNAKVEYTPSKDVLNFFYSNPEQCSKAKKILRDSKAQNIKKLCNISGFLAKAK